MSQKWEYLTLMSKTNYGTTKYYINDQQQPTLKDGKLSVIFNQLGGQGWELVGVNEMDRAQIYIFKRPSVRAAKAATPESEA